MIIPRDQFLSWSLLSARAADWRNSAGRTPYAFYQARNALYFSMDVLRMQPSSQVLAPAYICRAAVDPLTAWGARVEYYAVKSDCSIDFDDLERRMTAQTRAILMVHYFGFPQPLARLRALCDERGIALIEDCAHVLAGDVDGSALGSIGDVAVFSWRKFLPTYDGADLFVNRPQERPVMQWTPESALLTLKIGANLLETSLSQTAHPVGKAGYWALRTAVNIFRRGAKSYLESAPTLQVPASDVAFDVAAVSRPMSRLTRWTLNHSMIPAVIARRRRHYRALSQALESLHWVQPVFAQLPESVCPWVLPVRFAGLREAHLQLRNQGIPAVTWDGVRPPAVQRGAFPAVDGLYDELVFLPIHQSLTENDLQQIVRAIGKLK